jgi:hypothetical protein
VTAAINDAAHHARAGKSRAAKVLKDREIPFQLPDDFTHPADPKAPFSMTHEVFYEKRPAHDMAGDNADLSEGIWVTNGIGDVDD